MSALEHPGPSVVVAVASLQVLRHTIGFVQVSRVSSMARMTVVDRDGKEHQVEAKPGLKVMEILRELDYGVAAICGGLCSCATCHVYIDEAWVDRLPAKQSDEQELLVELTDYREQTSRLSCQVEFTEDLDNLKLTIAQDG